ncbi:bumetanide-sensitive sodium-(potassium)-chloride cotransporter [Trichogramma pretiosum]|uniref:bumetanide-sensitive sodium-(potassium)-chloride cotransporter n=1 Tax=Trichogramma pretiosum TaxID=7493 RepID=UPI0006C9A391|nr:bumetanide-sensitive sodium-(potassium)-chloride cotransporter [Trichogramma pretiosum]XP_014229252.1 bumetanide-sensitive sodium-(potassium)-chloride cotransporter [Trichogramma pretiosum]
MTYENGKMNVNHEQDNNVVDDDAADERVELRALTGTGSSATGGPGRRTRFHVNRVDSMEGRASLLGQQDSEQQQQQTFHRKSLRNMTREALPRLDNYRNILSIQAAHRPSLDELHNPTLDKSTNAAQAIQNELHSSVGATGIKFGWIQGVLVRCLLNIWGVMLFLRLSWVVAQTGVGEAILLILTTTAVTTITSLSMSAISTNGLIKGGGTYYMISRSLGPEFGGSIGLIFSLANAVACAMYVVGFCESMVDCLKAYDVCMFDCDSRDIRVIGVITIAVLLLIVMVGMEWEAKTQIGLLVILLVAIADFVIGSLIGPKSDLERARGFVGYNAELFAENLRSDYRASEGTQHSFFSVFAIFFPAATGILAGANISGDLKDPQSSIPKGTLLAILITTISYIVIAVISGASVLRDASGDVADLLTTQAAAWNDSSYNNLSLVESARNFTSYGVDFSACKASQSCRYGSQNSFQVIELVSGFGPFIYAGCFAATLSSALASLVSAPKVFQALCKDKLYPGLHWFSGAEGKEPVRGYLLTFVIAISFILIGELNAIAPLISNFFLAAYTLVNFSTFHASFTKPIGWRPTFKYYNMWLSLAGSILCVAVMFLISWWTALITLSTVLALYLVVSYRKPDVNWGSTTQAQTYNNALTSVQHLDRVEEHVKNYRPQILVLTGKPSSRSSLLDFAHHITKNQSLLVAGHVIETALAHKTKSSLASRTSQWLRDNKIKAFYSVIDGTSFQDGATSLMQACGLGKMRPNILLMGYKQDWATCPRENLLMYFNVMHKAFDMHIAVALLRISEGDHDETMIEDDNQDGQKKPRARLPPNQSFTQLSQASSVSDVSMPGSPTPRRGASKIINESPNANNNANNSSANRTTAAAAASAAPGVGGGAAAAAAVSSNVEANNQQQQGLTKDILNQLSFFHKKQKKGTIDVWWLYDDGGLTLLLPYIMSTRRHWSACRLRVFALANRQSELEYEQRSMASLLSKFRIDYSALKVISDISRPAQPQTQKFFDTLTAEFLQSTNPDAENAENANEEYIIKESERIAMKEKTNRHLRLRELLHEHSMEANLIVMTLPMPRKGAVSAPLYMAWLEALTRDMPPFLLVRGNHTSVLTFYS